MSEGMVHAIDHVVLTVRDVEATIRFFEAAIGLTAITFAGKRRALIVGDQKINLQTLGEETRNHSAIGSVDLCLLTWKPMEQVIARLEAAGVPLVEGPVGKSGAKGPVTSVYFNDPDGNLIEIGTYGAQGATGA